MAKTEQFGQVAIRMGFVTESQVQAALEIQDSMMKAGKKRRLIGMIMLCCTNIWLGPPRVRLAK